MSLTHTELSKKYYFLQNERFTISKSCTFILFLSIVYLFRRFTVGVSLHGDRSCMMWLYTKSGLEYDVHKNLCSTKTLYTKCY